MFGALSKKYNKHERLFTLWFKLFYDHLWNWKIHVEVSVCVWVFVYNAQLTEKKCQDYLYFVVSAFLSKILLLPMFLSHFLIVIPISRV